jgi:hypothetical protein
VLYVSKYQRVKVDNERNYTKYKDRKVGMCRKWAHRLLPDLNEEITVHRCAIVEVTLAVLVCAISSFASPVEKDPLQLVKLNVIGMEMDRVRDWWEINGIGINMTLKGGIECLPGGTLSG